MFDNNIENNFFTRNVRKDRVANRFLDRFRFTLNKEEHPNYKNMSGKQAKKFGRRVTRYERENSID
jgi:hypothetical protein